MQTWNYKRYLASDSPSAAFGRTQINAKEESPELHQNFNYSNSRQFVEFVVYSCSKESAATKLCQK